MAPPLTMHPAVVALSLSEPASTASSSNAAMPRPPASPTDSPRPAVGGSSSSTRWGFGGHIPGLGTGVSARWLDPPVATATSLSPRLPAAATSASAAVGDLPEGHQHPSFAAASLRHLRSLPRVLWDSGVACSLSAALIFAVNALFVKLLKDSMPSTEIILVRSVISLMFCAYSAHRNPAVPHFYGHRRNMHLLFCRGVFGAAAMQCLYLSIFMLPLGDATTLFFFNPAMTTMAAWLILKEMLGWVGASGVLVSLGGLVVLTRPPFLFGHADSWDHQRTMGTLFGIASAVLAAGAFICIRLIGNKEQPLVTSSWFHSVALVSAVLPLCLSYPDPAVWPTASEAGILLVVGVTSFWGQLTLSRGFQLQTAARASAINLTQVVWSYLFGLVFLHDAITWMGALGSVLIGAGAVLVNVRSKPKPAPTPVSDAGPVVVVDPIIKAHEEAPLLPLCPVGEGEAEPLIGTAAVASDAAVEAGVGMGAGVGGREASVAAGVATGVGLVGRPGPGEVGETEPLVGTAAVGSVAAEEAGAGVGGRGAGMDGRGAGVDGRGAGGGERDVELGAWPGPSAVRMNGDAVWQGQQQQKLMGDAGVGPEVAGRAGEGAATARAEETAEAAAGAEAAGAEAVVTGLHAEGCGSEQEQAVVGPGAGSDPGERQPLIKC